MQAKVEVEETISVMDASGGRQAGPNSRRQSLFVERLTGCITTGRGGEGKGGRKEGNGGKEERGGDGRRVGGEGRKGEEGEG